MTRLESSVHKAVFSSETAVPLLIQELFELLDSARALITVMLPNIFFVVVLLLLFVQFSLLRIFDLVRNPVHKGLKVADFEESAERREIEGLKGRVITGDENGPEKIFVSDLSLTHAVESAVGLVVCVAQVLADVRRIVRRMWHGVVLLLFVEHFKIG